MVFEKQLTEGAYDMWALAEDVRGAKSELGKKHSVIVRQRAFLKIGSILISYLTIFVSLISLVFLLAATLWYGWHKLNKLKKRLKKDVASAGETVHAAFDALREDVREKIGILEKTQSKRELTKEERKILVQLKDDLTAAEKYIKKEIDRIEKEVK